MSAGSVEIACICGSLDVSWDFFTSWNNESFQEFWWVGESRDVISTSAFLCSNLPTFLVVQPNQFFGIGEAYNAEVVNFSFFTILRVYFPLSSSLTKKLP